MSIVGLRSQLKTNVAMSTTKSSGLESLANNGFCKKGFPFHFAAAEWQDSSPNKTKQNKTGSITVTPCFYSNNKSYHKGDVMLQ